MRHTERFFGNRGVRKSVPDAGDAKPIHLPGDGGFRFHRWPGDGAKMLRLVTAFNTREKDILAFIASAQKHAAGTNAAQSP